MKHTLELRRAVERILRAANLVYPTASGTAPCPVFDSVPDNKAKPYVNIANISSNSTLSTNTFGGYDTTIEVNVHTDKKLSPGSGAVNSLLGQITTALVGTDIVIPNAKVISPRLSSGRAQPLDNGAYLGIFILRCDIYDNEVPRS